jgi:hypothetical protein
MQTPSMNRSFSEHLRHIAEITVAVSGDWRIQYEHDQYKVYCYGNWNGNFETPEEALRVIPEYRRDSMKRQLDRMNQPEQITLFDVSYSSTEN